MFMPDSRPESRVIKLNLNENFASVRFNELLILAAERARSGSINIVLWKFAWTPLNIFMNMRSLRRNANLSDRFVVDTLLLVQPIAFKSICFEREEKVARRDILIKVTHEIKAQVINNCV